MSESGGQGGGSVASAGTVAAGAVVLPFTGGNAVVSYVILTAMLCGAVILLSKVVKSITARFLV
jgi:hypothetical protein